MSVAASEARKGLLPLVEQVNDDRNTAAGARKRPLVVGQPDRGLLLCTRRTHARLKLSAPRVQHPASGLRPSPARHRHSSPYEPPDPSSHSPHTTGGKVGRQCALNCGQRLQTP